MGQSVGRETMYRHTILQPCYAYHNVLFDNAGIVTDRLDEKELIAHLFYHNFAYHLTPVAGRICSIKHLQ